MKKSTSQKAFSLVELLVVISIFTIISSVVVFRQSKFSSDILITNLAYQMALEIRQAQTYGIGVQSANSIPDASVRFKYGYGIHLGADTANRPSATLNANNSFILFVDSDPVYNVNGNDHIYGDAGTGSGTTDNGEHVDTYRLPGGNTIHDFCVGDLSNVTNPSHANVQCLLGGAVHLTSIDITFLRPKPDAHIDINGVSTTGYAIPVTVILMSALGDKCKAVTTFSTGQISVNPNNVACTYPYN